MNSATHHVGAENKLNGVDHWTYSGNGCPSCYFSATDNEQIIGGVPGTPYPWNWDGISICSIVGTFFGTGGAGSLPGCLTPSSETTAVAGSVVGNVTVTAFDQTISDSAGDSFNGLVITEDNAANTTPVDTCWGSWSNKPKNTGVTIGPPWTVGAGQVAGEPNHWGWDLVGWVTTVVDYYRVQAPAHGKALPCGFINYQALKIQCTPGGSTVIYTPTGGNKLTGDIYSNEVKNCRNDISGWACKDQPY
jgi:hypothetical protein